MMRDKLQAVKGNPQHLKRIDAENIFSDFREKVNNFHRFFDKVQKAQSSPISINTGLTKFTFKVEGSADENPNDYTLNRIVNNLEFDIAIFDGSAVTLDILQLCCTLGGPIGKLLIKAKKYAEEKDQVIKLEFSLGGGINGNLKFSKLNANSPWEAKTELKGKVNIEILGKVHLKGSVLWVEFAVGAYIKSASKEDENNKTEIDATISARTEKNDIMIDGNLTFNGMTIYSAAYIEVGVKGETSQDNNDSDSLGQDSDAEIKAKRELKAKGSLPLLNKWEGSTNFGKVENFLT